MDASIPATALEIIRAASLDPRCDYANGCNTAVSVTPDSSHSSQDRSQGTGTAEKAKRRTCVDRSDFAILDCKVA